MFKLWSIAETGCYNYNILATQDQCRVDSISGCSIYKGYKGDGDNTANITRSVAGSIKTEGTDTGSSVGTLEELVTLMCRRHAWCQIIGTVYCFEGL